MRCDGTHQMSPSVQLSVSIVVGLGQRERSQDGHACSAPAADPGETRVARYEGLRRNRRGMGRAGQRDAEA
jgi:hypothetical protein